MAQRKCESSYVNIETPPGSHTHADKNINFQISFRRELRSQQIISFNSALWIDFRLFPIHSESTIFSCLVGAESHSVRVEVSSQADCLSVRITADTNRLLMLLLKPVSVRPQSSNLSLSPVIYWQHCICLPLPFQAEFLTNPVPGYWAIIKNVWQDLSAVRDGFSEASRAGEDGITQVGSTRRLDLRPWLPSQPPWNLRRWILFEKFAEMNMK